PLLSGDQRADPPARRLLSAACAPGARLPAGGARRLRDRGVQLGRARPGTEREQVDLPMASRQESAKAKRERTAEILSRLRAANPHPRIALDFRNAFELLVATVLAAQCTDERINMVTPELFRRFPTPRDLAGASLE